MDLLRKQTNYQVSYTPGQYSHLHCNPRVEAAVSPRLNTGRSLGGSQHRVIQQRLTAATLWPVRMRSRNKTLLRCVKKEEAVASQTLHQLQRLRRVTEQRFDALKNWGIRYNSGPENTHFRPLSCVIWTK
jgi:hypothetical protein